MTLVKFNQPRLLSPMFDRLFNEFFGDDFQLNTANGARVWRPAINIVENNNEFRMDIVVPGLNKDDFQVTVENNTLNISAKREVSNKEDETYRRFDFGSMEYQQSFTLPESVDASKISASYVNGILSVALPKLESAKPKPALTVKVK
jgi:HSP20 family protein